MTDRAATLLQVDFLDSIGRRQRAVIAARGPEDARPRLEGLGLHLLATMAAPDTAEENEIEAFCDANSPLVVDYDALDPAETKAVRDDLAAELVGKATRSLAAESFRVLSRRLLSNEAAKLSRLPAWLLAEMRAVPGCPDDAALAALAAATNEGLSRLAERARSGEGAAFEDLAPETWCFVTAELGGRARDAELCRTREFGFVVAARSKEPFAMLPIGQVADLFDARDEGFLAKFLVIERNDGTTFRLRYDRTASIFGPDHIAKQIRDLIIEHEAAGGVRRG